jgi:hypothetical protein
MDMALLFPNVLDAPESIQVNFQNYPFNTDTNQGPKPFH